MQNQKTIKIQRLRTVALDERESPEERLKAAARLLMDFGPTDRNIPIINKAVRIFENHADFEVSERAQKLKVKLAKSRGLKTAAKSVDLPQPEQTASELDETLAGPTSSSDVPTTMAVSAHDLIQAHVDVIGHYRWRMFDEGVDISKDERTQLLTKVLGERSLDVESVHSLYLSLQSKNINGFDLTSLSVFRIAADWLREHGAAPEPIKMDAAMQDLLGRFNTRS